MRRVIKIVQTMPLRSMCFFVLTLVGIWFMTATTRMLVAGIDLQRLDLDGGSYRVAIDEGRYGLFRHQRLAVQILDTDELPTLTYYSHEPSFTTLSRERGDRDATIWYEPREPWQLLSPVGTMHAAMVGGEFIFDTVNTYLHRRRLGSRFGVFAAILLLGVLPGFAVHLDRMSRRGPNEM